MVLIFNCITSNFMLQLSHFAFNTIMGNWQWSPSLQLRLCFTKLNEYSLSLTNLINCLQCFKCLALMARMEMNWTLKRMMITLFFFCFFFVGLLGLLSSEEYKLLTPIFFWYLPLTLQKKTLCTTFLLTFGDYKDVTYYCFWHILFADFATC